jgi:hypothetical protein
MRILGQKHTDPDPQHCVADLCRCSFGKKYAKKLVIILKATEEKNMFGRLIQGGMGCVAQDQKSSGEGIRDWGEQVNHYWYFVVFKLTWVMGSPIVSWKVLIITSSIEVLPLLTNSQEYQVTLWPIAQWACSLRPDPTSTGLMVSSRMIASHPGLRQVLGKHKNSIYLESALDPVSEAQKGTVKSDLHS